MKNYMNALTVIMLIFALLGALDRIIGNKFGLGAEFERGFMLLGNMSLAMIGMISLAPSIAFFVSPIFEAIYNAIASTLGLIISAVSCTPMFDMLNKMDRRGIILNSAFSVFAAFLLGGHLAYTMTLDPNYVFPMILAKLISGPAALIPAFFFSRNKKDYKK